MKSYGLSCLPLLLLIVQWDRANGQCSLVKTTAAKCRYLEDARYIDTYHLHILQAPSMSHTLTPGNFLNLTSLRHLDLSGGNIERIESGSFAKLSSLQTLNLAENSISHLDVGAFDGLKHLHSLHLSKNQIRQLPAALMALKELRLLDVSDNPLYCNCASMKLRDTLLVRGVKISKNTHCSEPVFARHASILKPDTKIICAFEKQDQEMQGDQPAFDSSEVSGEPERDEALDEELEKEFLKKEKAREKKLVEEDKSEEKEEEHTAVNEVEEETAFHPAVTEKSSTASSVIDNHSVEVTSTTAAARDDSTFDHTEDLKKGVTTESSVHEVTDDLVYAVTISKEPEAIDEAVGIDSPKSILNDDRINQASASEGSGVGDDEAVGIDSPKSDLNDDLIIEAPASEGSGMGDDDGSGVEGSGLISKMPAIDFSEDAEEVDEETLSTTSTTTTTTEGSSWWGFGDIINNLNPFLSSETTQAPHTTENTAEQDLEEEQFIAVKENIRPVETTQDVQPAKKAFPSVSDKNTTKKSPRTLKLPDNNDSNDVDEKAVDPAMSKESRKGMGSYIVLAILLAILAILVGIAAYKGDFCRSKPKRRDVERGTEMKDMRKSLLDQNSTQPKIQASNGNTMENVPLMNSSTLPGEPKANQRCYDITPVVVTNGVNKSNGPNEVSDPIKPPRKPTHPEIEAPLNGLNPPMDDIDGPTRNSLLNGSNEILNNGDCCERPPLSPGAQRVTITLQENPDSVPKTPILITRLKGGENLVKAP